MKKLLFLIIALFATNLAFGQFSTDVSVSGLTPATGPMCDGLYPVTILVTNMDPVQPTNGPVPVLYSLDGTLVSTVFTSGPLAGGASELVTLGMFGNKPGKHRITVGANYAGDLNPMNNVGDNYVTVQFNGTYSVGALPTDHFLTLKMAIDTLNFYGVCGATVINMLPGYTESNTAPLILTATGTAVNTITFQKNGIGANPIISRTDAGTLATSALGGQGDAVIIIQGSDYVTFDGISVSTADQGIEYGYYLRKASVTNGCKNISILNSAITLTKGTSGYVVGIYSSNNDAASLVSSATGITVTSIGGRNENITINGNSISNVFTGIVLRGYNHAVAPYDFCDLNFTVGASGAGNTITNYAGNNTGSSYGIYGIYYSNFQINYNTINNAGGGGSNATGTLYGIFLSNGSAAGTMALNNNNVTLSQGSTSLATAISYAGVGTSLTVNNNRIGYGAFASTSISYIISCNSATNDISVTGNKTVGTITKTGIGTLYAFYNNGSPTGGTQTISGNNFSNISVTGASPFYGISTTTAAAQSQIISNDTVSNITGGTSTVYGIYATVSTAIQINNNLVNTISSAGTVYGINFTGTNSNVYRNLVYGLATTGASMYGMLNGATGNGNCYKNTIYNLSSSNTAPSVFGLYITAGTNNNSYNNFISDLKAASASATNAISGIYVNAGTTIGVFYNTVYLNATSVGVNFGTSGIYASTTPTVDVRNNIIVNASTPAGTGLAVAYRRSNATLTSYSANSNYNCLYAGTPSSKRLIFFDGTNSDSTLAQYQTRVAARDASSFSVIPPFVNIAATPYDLHLQTSVSTMCESGGIRITSPIGITDDFDANLRQGETGYAGAGSAPDVGADEIEGIPSFTCVAPVPGNTLSTSNPVCNGQNIILSLQTPGSGTGLGYQWQDSPDNITYTNISGANAATYPITPSVNGVYYQCIVTCQNGPSTGTSTPIQITFANSITGTTPATRCGTGTVTLSATGSAGTSINWYSALTGGSLVGTGNNFTTPVISSTTTYYAEAGIFGAMAFGARTAPAGTSSTTTSNYGLVFDLNSSIILDSVDVFPNGGAGTVTIQLQTNTGTPIYTSPSISVPAGAGATAYSIYLGWSIPSGTGYRLIATSGTSSMVRESALGGFPYALSAVGNITSGYLSGTSTTYYYFYNWAFTPVCASLRSAVVATVTPAPAITPSATPAAICLGDASALNVTSPNDPNYTYTWMPGSLTGAAQSVSPAATTTYTVTAIDNSGFANDGCVNTATVGVTVNPLPQAVVVTPSADTLCQNAILQLNATGGLLTGSGVIGSGVTSSAFTTPFRGFYGGSKLQILYTAAELTSLGMSAGNPITQISFGFATFTSPYTFNGFTVGMKNTASTVLTTTIETGLTEVIAPSAFTLTGTAPFTQSLALSTPFVWDGTSNLLIETCFNNNDGGGVSGNNATVYYTATGTNLTCYYSADNTATVCSAPGAATTSTSRPNVVIDFLKANPITWAPLTDLYTDAGATVAYTGTPATSVYTMPTANRTYTATATTGAGCTASATSVITHDDLAISLVTATDITCNGLGNGSITVTTTGGFAPIQYSIDGGGSWQASNSFTSLIAGSYTVSVKDLNNCVVNYASNPVVIVEPAAVAISSVIKTDLTTCAGTDGTITITATGGTGAYSYSIDNASSWQLSGTYTGLPAGSYNVQVKDVNNCTVIYTSNPVVIATPIAVVIDNVTNDNNSCFNSDDAHIIITASAGTAPYQYSIDGGVNYFSNGGSFNNLAPGTYNVYVRDNSSCIAIYASNPIVITEPDVLDIALTATDVLCNGGATGTATAVVTGGTTPYDYAWTPSGGTNAAATGLIAGTYTVTVGDDNGCTLSESIIVNEPSVLAITGVTPVNLLCFNGTDGSITIAATGGTPVLQYSIDNGANWQLSNAFTGLIAGSYTVIVKDNNNCQVAYVSNPVVLTQPGSGVDITNVASTANLCYGGNAGTITVTASGGVAPLMYSINNGGSWQLSNSFSGLIAGNYTVLVKDDNNCQLAYTSNPVIITEPGVIDITSVVVTAPSCNGTADASITVVATGGTGLLQYSINNGTTYQTSNIFNGLIAGSYTITVEDANLCEVAYTSNPLIITDPATVAISNVASVNVLCFGNNTGSITVTANGGSTPLLYSIDNGTTFQTSNVFGSLIAGSYNLIVKDSNDCSLNYASNPIVITGPAAALAISNLVATNVGCSGGNNGGIVITATGGTTTYQYSVNNGTTWQTSGTYSTLIAGSYTVLVKDANNCQVAYASNPVIITQPAAAIGISSVTHTNVLCLGNSDATITITGTGGTPSYQYSIDNGSNYQASNIFTGLGTGSYTIRIKDANNCTVAYASNPVVITEPATAVSIASAVGTDLNCNGGLSGIITVTASGGTGVLQYSADNGTTWTSSNVITGLAAGTHNIWVRDANLCTAAYSGNPVTLLEPNPIIITGFSSTNVLCHGSTDGSIEVYAIGGTGALQYSIDSGATWQSAFTFNGLAAGNYDVMAQDANNCIVAFGTNPVVITEPASIIITNVVTVKNLCNGGTDASIEITATGGTGALEYTINNGLSWTSTGLFTGLTAGSYTIRVRDENYCVYNYSANPLVLVDPPAIVINNVDSTDITTYGGSDGTIQIIAYGGTGPLQYSVDNGASWQFGNTFGGLIAGGYFLWVQDENGCMAQYWSNPVILTQPSGIDENGNMPGVMIYPDPSQGEITIEAFNMTDLQKIEITTIEGKVLDIITGETFMANNMKMKYEFAADVKGMYFVRLTTGDKVYVKKIVVN